MAIRGTTCFKCGWIKKDGKCRCTSRLGGYIGTPKRSKADTIGKRVNDSTRWKKLRLYIKKRDGGICQRCWSKNILTSNNLNVHHVIHLHLNESLAYDTDNLVTLCKKCHYDVHAYCKSGSLDFEFSPEKETEYNL